MSRAPAALARHLLTRHESREHPQYPLSLGAIYLGHGRCRFCVWGSKVQRIELHLLGEHDRLLPMERDQREYYTVVADGVAPGALYRFRLDGERELPDPASRSQPEGVHEASQVVAPQFDWNDDQWHGRPLREYVIYELHVGTFTTEGTFDAAVAHLDELRELGITAVELLPVAQFPGGRNWGYDGVHPFAVQNTYGGPDGLRRLVDACHAREMAVVLDVVYNHLGPEGNYFREFGHYFTERHRTLWGEGLNFDGPRCDEVRRFFIENALYWLREFHIDAFRLDAADAIYDQSARPFLQELADAVRDQGERLNRRVYTIAETALNDVRFIRSREIGGHGLSAQWNDEFHHAVHTELTGEREGYYEDYRGFPDLVTSLREGYVHTGQYSPYRRRRHGVPSREYPPEKFVVCVQNHDQVGNRKDGERLTELTDFEGLKLAAGALLLSPYVPLLFMGEEYGEPAPFQYFISHLDPDLVDAVRRGRKNEFARFHWQGDPPDPQAVSTFARSRLNHDLKRDGRGRVLWELYRELLELRRIVPSLADLSREHMRVRAVESQRLLILERRTRDDAVLALFHFGATESRAAYVPPAGLWTRTLDSAHERWLGPGRSLPELLRPHEETILALSPRSFALYLSVEGER